MCGNSLRRGFTLLEMSITLVVIGLIIGGVLVGQSLIRTSEVNNIPAEFNKLQSAVRIFQEQYNAFPGDITNATQFWGRADDGTFSGQCANPGTDVGSGTQTCNGNGNNTIYHVFNSSANGESYEQYRFWQHLANAGLISGTYTGVHGTGGIWHAQPGINTPKSSLGAAGWGFNEAADTNVVHYWAERDGLDVRNTWILGTPGTTYTTEGPAFSPIEAWSIDKKLDDGMPGRGIVVVRPRPACSDSTGPGDYDTAEYKMSEDQILCSLIFPLVM